MGNGFRGLTQVDIESAALAAANNFGMPNILFMPMTGIIPWFPHPEYQGTAWADIGRLTKREMKVAALHTFLVKMKAINITEEEWSVLYRLSMKRLKRAKWAQYGKKR